MASEEARYLGRTFHDSFLKIKRLIQAQSAYRAQVDVFRAFTGEGFLTDDVVLALEKLIEWKE